MEYSRSFDVVHNSGGLLVHHLGRTFRISTPQGILKEGASYVTKIAGETLERKLQPVAFQPIEDLQWGRVLLPDDKELFFLQNPSSKIEVPVYPVDDGVPGSYFRTFEQHQVLLQGYSRADGFILDKAAEEIYPVIAPPTMEFVRAEESGTIFDFIRKSPLLAPIDGRGLRYTILGKRLVHDSGGLPQIPRNYGQFVPLDLMGIAHRDQMGTHVGDEGFLAACAAALLDAYEKLVESRVGRFLSIGWSEKEAVLRYLNSRLSNSASVPLEWLPEVARKMKIEEIQRAGVDAADSELIKVATIRKIQFVLDQSGRLIDYCEVQTEDAVEMDPRVKSNPWIECLEALLRENVTLRYLGAGCSFASIG